MLNYKIGFCRELQMIVRFEVQKHVLFVCCDSVPQDCKSYGADIEISSISIFNINGKLVSQESIKNNQFEIDEDAGMYFVKVIFKDGTELMQKVIKQ